MKPEALAGYIDHTLLATNATEEKIVQLCGEASNTNCLRVRERCWTAVCASLLADTKVNVCTVVGFPLGAMKREQGLEASQAIADGAREIDMVINVGWLKQDGSTRSNVHPAREGSLRRSRAESHHRDCLLSDEEKADSLSSRGQCGRDFVKTSTGFSTGVRRSRMFAHIARHRRRRGRSQSLRRLAQL